MIVSEPNPGIKSRYSSVRMRRDEIVIEWALDWLEWIWWWSVSVDILNLDSVLIDWLIDISDDSSSIGQWLSYM